MSLRNHASYLTQFHRKATLYSSADVALRIKSKRAVDRRLVLPLESGHWMRALEVLRARYAQQGTTAHHYEQVVRSMMGEDVLSDTRRKFEGNSAPEVSARSDVLSLSRDAIPVLNSIRDQAFEGSIPSSQHLWLALVRAYCSGDDVEGALECIQLAQTRYRNKEGLLEQVRVAMAREVIPRLARRPGYYDAFTLLVDTLVPRVLANTEEVEKWKLQVAAVNGVWSEVVSDARKSGVAGQQHVLNHFVKGEVPASALQSLIRALGTEGKWAEALSLLLTLEQTGKSALEARRIVMDTLGKSGRWVQSTLLWEALEGMKETGECLTHPRSAFDPVLLSLMLHALPSPKASSDIALYAVKVLNHLCNHRDDFRLDNDSASVLLESLLQVGDWTRALHLIGSTPLLKGMAGSKPRGAMSRNEQQLARMLYHLHGHYSQEARDFTMRRYPYAFPKEVVAAYFSQGPKMTSQEDLLEKKIADPSSMLSLRRNRQDMFLTTSSTVLTEDAESRMKQNVRRMGEFASAKFVGDADSDPRPVPKGLFDTASGWHGFNGRGGEKMFMNSKNPKSAHPFSARPKFMSPLKDKTRTTWKLSQNSSAAHKMGVRKWNGHTAV